MMKTKIKLINYREVLEPPNPTSIKTEENRTREFTTNPIIDGQWNHWFSIRLSQITSTYLPIQLVQHRISTGRALKTNLLLTFLVYRATLKHRRKSHGCWLVQHWQFADFTLKRPATQSQVRVYNLWSDYIRETIWLDYHNSTYAYLQNQ